MPLELSIFTALCSVAISMLALLYIRPRALASPGAGYHLWPPLLASSLAAIVLAGYTIVRGETLAWTLSTVLLAESAALLLTAFALFYIRPRFAADPSLRPYRLWPLLLLSAMTIAIAVLFILRSPST